MDKKILCKKLGKELPALKVPPMPGPKGLEVMNSVSEEAWEMWKSHQTTLINEKHLDMSDPENRKYLMKQKQIMEKNPLTFFVRVELKELLVQGKLQQY